MSFKSNPRGGTGRTFNALSEQPSISCSSLITKGDSPLESLIGAAMAKQLLDQGE